MKTGMLVAHEDMEVEAEGSGLQRVLNIAELRDKILTYFHPSRLEDIQGVVSLWSLGLWSDDQVREHFLDGHRPRDGDFLSPDMDPQSQLSLVKYAMKLENENSLNELSKEDLWIVAKYQRMIMLFRQLSSRLL